MHIFAGDFNSLTKWDKYEDEWAKMAAEREDSSAELEEPKFEVAASMAQKNFSDCWDQVGRRPGNLETTCE